MNSKYSQVKASFVLVLCLISLCVLVWSFLFAGYYGKQALELRVENERLLGETQRLVSKIAEIEQQAEKLKSLVSVIDQYDFAATQTIAAGAGKIMPPPLFHQDQKNNSSEREWLGGLAFATLRSLLPASPEQSQSSSEPKEDKTLSARLAEVGSDMGRLLKHVEQVIAHLGSRKALIKRIPSRIPVPAQSSTLTSRFGMRFNPYLLTDKHHAGIDFAAPLGTDVQATAEGRIELASFSESYGKQIIINHGNGIKTRYAHNSKLRVKVGQQVDKGQIIAEVGRSGHSTDFHSHYEVLLNDLPVNPEAFFYETPHYAIRGRAHNKIAYKKSKGKPTA